LSIFFKTGKERRKAGSQKYNIYRDLSQGRFKYIERSSYADLRKTNVPPITSIENAISVYYRYPEIGNKQIIELFGDISHTTIAKIKKHVKDEMYQQDIFSYGANTVNTEIAYQVFGLDISDLEHRLTKLQQFGLSS